MIVRENDFATASKRVSVTCATKLAVPSDVGLPEIDPAAESVSPAGKDPEVIDHVYGSVPPEAVNACEYEAPTEPAGKGEDVVIESAPDCIVIDRSLEDSCDSLSKARTVKATVPVDVGVPLIAPAADSVSPGGNDPEMRDQE